MALNTAFNPARDGAITVTTGGASATAEVGKGSKTLVVTNTGSDIAYIAIGPSDVTASASDFLLVPGLQVALGKDEDHTHIAHIQDSAPTDLHIIPGEGKF